MRRILPTIGALVLAASAHLFSAQITVADNSASSVLSPITGTGTLTQVKVAWPSFTSTDGTSVAAGSITVPAIAGSFSVALASNAGLSPASFYTFTFVVSPLIGYTNELYSALVILPGSGSTATLAQSQVTAPWYSGSGSSPSGGSSTTSGILQGATSITVGLTVDGSCIVQSPTILVSGALPGSPVSIGETPALPNGFRAEGEVTSPNAVSVTVCNESGSNATPGTASYTVAVIQQ